MPAQPLRLRRSHPLRKLLPRLVLTALAILCLLPMRATLADTVEPPVLVSPVLDEVTTATNYPPLGNPVFRWEPVEGASRYEIEVSRSVGFGVVEHRGQTASTKYVPTVSLADGTYFWHVRAYAGITRSDYSPVQSFVKDWSDGGRVRPILQSPTDGHIHSRAGYPAFTWDPVPGAATYFFEISSTPQFAGDPVYDEEVIKETHTPATTALGNGVYYWRVIPVDYRSNSGVPSEVRQFTLAWNHRPGAVAPEDDVHLAFTPAFSWQAIPGAREYVLEISSESDFSTLVAAEVTKNTAFTPLDPLSNDQEYYWRVYGVDAAGNNSPYSEARRFTIRMLPPEPLTPVNNQGNVSSPIFSWTPVAGAKAYQIQCDESTGFAAPLLIDDVVVHATHYTHGRWELPGFPTTVYWRVRAMDAAEQFTDWSRIQAFRFDYTTAPTPIYPPYYYIPNSELTPVHSDPTIANPLFIWDAVVDAFGRETHFPGAAYYVLDVDDSPIFNSVNFQVTTAAQGAAPTTANPFTGLQDGKLYYWRVRAYHANGTQLATTQRAWPVRINTTLPEIPATEEMTLMYPADGHEVVEHAPILGWQPVIGASQYEVQIARDRSFTALVDEANPTFINYVPWQGRTERLPVGRYYWRVRTSEPLGDWLGSEVRAFNVNHRLLTGMPDPDFDYVLPAPISEDSLNHVISDPDEGHGDSELTGLYAALDRTVTSYDWVIGFKVAGAISANMHYMLLFDSDHIPGSGATQNPLGMSLSIGYDSRPEYALTLTRHPDSTFGDASFWEWSGNDIFGWGAPQFLDSMQGSVDYFTMTHFVQIRIPLTALTPQDWDDRVGSIGLAVMSVPGGSASIADCVPSNETSSLQHLAYISDLLNPIFPFDTPLSNPMVHFDLPLMRWLLPSWDSVDGYQAEVARDYDFTDVVYSFESRETGIWWVYSPIPNAFVPTDAYPDNETYYWRVRVRHERYQSVAKYYDYGPWTRPYRFKLDSRIPTNAMAAPTDTTPTFSWDRVQGAGAYRLQVAQDANFSDPLIDEDIANTSYTPSEKLTKFAMPDGTYFWRVAIKRDDNIYGRWTSTMTFTKTSLAPEPLEPIEGLVINELPTFTWREVLSPQGSPYLSTPQYKLIVADNPNFDNAKSFITSATSFSPPQGEKFADGNWYWKVATYDRNRNEGTYSPVQTFYKEYLKPELVSPASGQAIETTPLFSWTPINGAAYYEVEIDDNPAFTNVRSPVKTDNTSYVPTYELGDTYTFYWRVRMVDADRVAGPLYSGVVEAFTSRVNIPFLMKSP